MAGHNAPAKIYTGFFAVGAQTIDLTTSGFGPAAAAYMVVNNGRAGGADQGSIRGSIGYWSGYSGVQGCCGHSHNNTNAQGLSRGTSNHRSGRIAEFHNNTTENPQGSVTASAITDGVRLTVSLMDAARYYMVMVFPQSEWSGAEVSFEGATTDVQVGFTPDVILGASCYLTGANAFSAAESTMGIGMAAINAIGGSFNAAHHISMRTGDYPLPLTDNNYKTLGGFMVRTNTSPTDTVQFIMQANLVAGGWTTSFSAGNPSPNTNHICYLSMRSRKKRLFAVVANNITSGLTTKNQTNLGWTPECCMMSNLGSGTGNNAVRTSNVSTWSLWNSTGANTTIGGYIRNNVNVNPNQAFSAGNTVRAIGKDLDGVGEWQTTSTSPLVNGISWTLTNSITQNTHGILLGISYPLSNIWRGDENVWPVNKGSTFGLSVFKGSERICSGAFGPPIQPIPI